MLGKFSLEKLNSYGGQSASFFLILYLFTMIIMIMNFFVAILNDFLAAVANSKEMQSRDFEVMDHFVNTVAQMVTSRTEESRLRGDGPLRQHCGTDGYQQDRRVATSR